MIPAIREAYRTRHYGEMAVYGTNMLASGIYHACDYRFYCFGFKSRTLRFIDFFFSYFSVCASFIYLAKMKPDNKTAAYVVSVVLLLIAGLQSNFSSISTAILVVPKQPPLFAGSIPLYSYGITIYRVSKYRYNQSFSMSALKAFFFENDNFDWVSALSALAFVGCAAMCHMIETNQNYFLVRPRQIHSGWHVCIMLSAFFTLRIPYFRSLV